MNKHIIVITTGGTIAMKPDPKTGGLVPAVSGEDLAAAVPGLSDWAERLDGCEPHVETVPAD